MKTELLLEFTEVYLMLWHWVLPSVYLSSYKNKN